jgi:guanosine-3',5'-bis(diphosphate) 3'-pyrophosphohydrolase
MTVSFPLYNQGFYSRDEMIRDICDQVDPAGLTMTLSAYEMGANVHERQVRSDATPYFWHISRVGKILVRELKYFNAEVLSAAFLHDVLEDTEVISAEVLKYNFGSYVSYIVEVLTKNISLLGAQREVEDQQYLERLRDSSVDCKIIKFAERLDNFRCLEFGVKKNPFEYIDGTERDYFPMAEALNNRMLNLLMSEMKKVKGKLLA